MRGLAVVVLVACGSPHDAPTPTLAPLPPLPKVDPVLQPVEDPYEWLEQVETGRALGWARAQNARSTAVLEAVPGFAKMRARVRAILDAQDKVPFPTKRDKYIYNFWEDEANPRGLWRRTTPAEYRKAQPAWETVLDIDALNKAEGASWVFLGSVCLYPKYERCLVELSRGGADAVILREFDLVNKQFVQGGFATTAEAKLDVTWKDRDTLYIATDWGAGSTTESGYARIVKEWKRGTPLASATTIFEGKRDDVSVTPIRQFDHGHIRDIISRSITAFSNETLLWNGTTTVRIDKPNDADVGFWDDQILLSLRTDWNSGGKIWPAGSLLAANLDGFLAGERAFTPLFTPTPTTSLNGYVGAKSTLYVAHLEDVRDGLVAWTRTGNGKARAWKSIAVTPPASVSITINAWDPDENDDYWMYGAGFVTPQTISLVASGKVSELKRAQSHFDATGLEVTQRFATSKDGTRVPYWMVAKKSLVLDGNTPTLIEGYGGFELSLTPYYDALVGVMWLERGGAYVVPNLRGGGEYGPKWHQAGILHERQRVYDDFAAVAEDLIARKITRPAKLGIKGGSNGGLLVGVMMTERPELFGAVVCHAPLLDMKRYHKLLAGASWEAEYGDPDKPVDWATLAKYSPYQNVHEDVKYPPVLFTTSTRDDRVHPAHARKMAARMIEQGHDVLFYENIEGGHGGAADHEQRAFMSTLHYAFLWKQLGVPVD